MRQAQPISCRPSSASQTTPNSLSLREALVDHRLVALLEDVQRHDLGRAARRAGAGTAGSSLAMPPDITPALRACARSGAGCRRAPAEAAVRARAHRAAAGADSRGRRSAATTSGRRRGPALASSPRLNQPNQLATSSSPRTVTSVKPARARESLRGPWARTRGCRPRPRARGPIAPGSAAAGLLRARRRTQRARQSGRRQHARRAWARGRGGRRAARARRRRGSSARAQHAMELGEGAVEVGQVMQHRVAEHKVEALIAERQRLGVGTGRCCTLLEPEPLRRCRSAPRTSPTRCRCR